MQVYLQHKLYIYTLSQQKKPKGKSDRCTLYKWMLGKGEDEMRCVNVFLVFMNPPVDGNIQVIHHCTTEGLSINGNNRKPCLT